jgi:phosphorylcholine metabolism protein LicD
MILKKRILISVILACITYVGVHLERQDPYQPSPILNAAHMTQKEIQKHPLYANSLTLQAAQELYTTLAKTKTILDQHHIDFWITCATLLGAVRHEGVIPTDDDIDVAVWNDDCNRLLALKHEFAQAGLGIYKDRTSIKIYKLNGPHVRPKQKSFQLLAGLWFVRHKKERFPTLDIHPMQKEGRRIVLAYPKARQIFTKEYYFINELEPLRTYTFGPVQVQGPAHPRAFLERRYGPTWNDVVYFASRHVPGTGQTFTLPLSKHLREQFYRFGSNNAAVEPH